MNITPSRNNKQSVSRIKRRELDGYPLSSDTRGVVTGKEERSVGGVVAIVVDVVVVALLILEEGLDPSTIPGTIGGDGDGVDGFLGGDGVGVVFGEDLGGVDLYFRSIPKYIRAK